MSKIRKNWVVIIAGIIGVVAGVAIMFWDKIEDIYDHVRNK